MTEFNEELDRVLRYSMDDAANLLQQLHQNLHARLPQPEGADPSNNEHTLFRNVVADKLAELGRTDEEGLLRNPTQHIVVKDGEVRAGQLTTEHIDRQLQHINDIRLRLPVAAPPNTEWYHAEYTGNPHWPFALIDANDGGRTVTRGKPHQFGSVVANLIRHRVNSQVEAAGLDHEMAENIYQNLIEHLTTVPVDDVDPNHPHEVRRADKKRWTG